MTLHKNFGISAGDAVNNDFGGELTKPREFYLENRYFFRLIHL